MLYTKIAEALLQTEKEKDVADEYFVQVCVIMECVKGVDKDEVDDIKQKIYGFLQDENKTETCLV